MEYEQHDYSVTTSVVLKHGGEQYIYSKPRSLFMKHLIGDGLAKLTMSSELNDKTYGDGVSCMVSVTVTVDQSENAIADAAQILRVITGEEARTALAEFRDIYRQMKADGKK